MKEKLYRPSNGTEGDYFMGKFCYQCIHDNPDYNVSAPRCDIMTATMCYDINDKEYPKEWTYDDNNEPICTKFVKWDWDNDGSPNDPDNPKAPIPDDPNQLIIPFIIDDINNNV